MVVLALDLFLVRTFGRFLVILFCLLILIKQLWGLSLQRFFVKKNVYLNSQRAYRHVLLLILLQWLSRRHALQQRAQQGIPVSEYGVLVDMIRVPDWAFEAVGLEMRGMGQDTAYHPGLYLTAAQVSCFAQFDESPFDISLVCVLIDSVICLYLGI
jgi:hypothetical protein